MPMSFRLWLCLSITTLFLTVSFCQESSKLVSNDYDRCALTFLWNNYNYDKYLIMKKEAFSKHAIVPEKYDDNTLSDLRLSMGDNPDKVTFESNAPVKIQNLLQENNIPNKVIAFWFNQQTDGTFQMNRIAERGHYNATLGDINQAMFTNRGLAMVKDAGLNLVDRSHILVFDITEIRTMEEIAKKRNISASSGDNNVLSNSMNPARKNGYNAEAKLYLYKLDFTDSIAAIFYNNYWVSPNDSPEVKKEKKQALEELDFPVSFVMEFSASVSATQIKKGYSGAPVAPKSMSALFQDLVADGIESLIEKMERDYEGCSVKSYLKTVRPITARIGRKEGVFVDQRYFVYENVQKKEGVVSKRRGVIRTKQVANNKGVADENNQTSVFYQTGGGKLNSTSMFIGQKNDMGIGISAGYSSGAFTGPMFRLEINLSQLIDKAAKSNPKPGIKIYGDLGITAKDYPDAGAYLVIPPEDDTYSFASLGAGFAKEYYFLHIFQFTPHIGYQYETASWSNDDEESHSIYRHGAAFGTRFGLSLYHSVQLCYTANFQVPINGTVQHDEKYVIDTESKYTTIFDDRGSGLSHIFQLRIIF